MWCYLYVGKFLKKLLYTVLAADGKCTFTEILPTYITHIQLESKTIFWILWLRSHNPMEYNGYETQEEGLNLRYVNVKLQDTSKK